MIKNNNPLDNNANENSFAAEIKEKMNTLDHLIKLREKQLKHDVELSSQNEHEQDEDDETGMPGYSGIF